MHIRARAATTCEQTDSMPEGVSDAVKARIAKVKEYQKFVAARKAQGECALPSPRRVRVRVRVRIARVGALTRVVRSRPHPRTSRLIRAHGTKVSIVSCVAVRRPSPLSAFQSVRTTERRASLLTRDAPLFPQERDGDERGDSARLDRHLQFLGGQGRLQHEPRRRKDRLEGGHHRGRLS